MIFISVGLSAVHIGIICATLVVLVVVVIGSIIIILWYMHSTCVLMHKCTFLCVAACKF